MSGQIYWICEPSPAADEPGAAADSLPQLPAGWTLLRQNTVQALQSQAAPVLLIVDQLQQQAVAELAALGSHSIRVLTVPDCQDEQLLPYIADFHLFYPQPLQAQALQQLILIAQALAALKLPPTCQQQLLACTHLPVIPPVIQQLQQLLLDPDVRIARLAEVIEQDLVLSARLLQLANSAYMGFNHDTASVQMAISRLGLSLLYGLLLALSVAPALTGDRLKTDSELASMQLASSCRQVGQWLGLDNAALEQVVVAALFHQLGLALLQGATGDISAIDPAQAGAFMLTLWGFAPGLTDILLQQQTLATCADHPFALCLYLARQRQTAAAPDAALDAVLTELGLRAYWPAAPVNPVGG